MIRKMMLGGIFVVVFLVYVSILHSGEFSVDEHTLFLAHFDKGIDADSAKGNPKATGYANIDPNGKYGGALSARNEAQTSDPSRSYCPIGFEVKNNLNPQMGTLEMWINTSYDSSKNPKNSAGYAFYVIFKIKKAGVVSEEKDFNKVLFSIREINYSTDSRVAMLSTGKVDNFLECFVGNREKTWTHYAITWENGKVALFVDGKRVLALLENPNGMLYLNPVPDSDKFYIGGNMLDDFKPADLGSNANSLIDEVRISDIVRYTENFTPEGDK